MESNLPSSDFSPRSFALVTGVGLLLMAILAPIANFGIVEALVVPGDSSTTVKNILASISLFRTGILLFLIVAVLDVLVAWGLYGLLKPVNPSLSLLTAWVRVVYAAILVVALASHLNVLQLVGGDYVQLLGMSQLKAEIMLSLNAFTDMWNLGMAIFGIHLLLIGYLVFRSGFIPGWLGILIFIAGLGYSIDSLGKILSPQYDLNLSAFTFVGEVLLIFWCLWKGVKGLDLESA